jgi:hypothetical protein
MNDYSQVKYKITKFNAKENQLDVDFDDGTWAKIQLKAPLPPNQKELETILQQFVAPKEVAQIKNEESNLDYIKELVGQDILMPRLSVNPNPKNFNNDKIIAKHELAEVLIEFGILDKNPVDLSKLEKEIGEVKQPISIGTQTL